MRPTSSSEIPSHISACVFLWERATTFSTSERPDPSINWPALVVVSALPPQHAPSSRSRQAGTGVRQQNDDQKLCGLVSDWSSSRRRTLGSADTKAVSRASLNGGTHTLVPTRCQQKRQCRACNNRTRPSEDQTGIVGAPRLNSAPPPPSLGLDRLRCLSSKLFGASSVQFFVADWILCTPAGYQRFKNFTKPLALSSSINSARIFTLHSQALIWSIRDDLVI